jgi:hypothetical protein
MTVAFAVFLFIHAAAHAVGFISISGIAPVEDVDGKASLLLTRFEPGHPVMWAASLLWLVGLGGFVAAGVGVLTDASWTLPVLIVTMVLSSLICFIWVKDTPFGLAANAVIVIVLLVPALHDRVLPG